MWKSSLRWRIAFVVGLIFSLLLGIGIFGEWLFYKKDMGEYFQKYGKELISSLAPALANTLEENNDLEMLKYLRQLEANEDIQRSMIIDTQGNIRGHTDVYRIGESFPRKDLLEKLQSQKDSYLELVKTEEGRSALIGGHILQNGDGKTLGFLYVELTMTKIIQKGYNLMISLVIYFLTGTILFILSSILLLQREVIIPTRALRNAIQTLSPQFLEFGFSSNYATEINQLAQTMESFIQRLKDVFQRDNLKGKEQIKKLFSEILRIIGEGRRFLVADLDNRIIFSNFSLPVGIDSAEYPHLLDLIKDEKFLKLLNQAFQKPGGLFREEVEFLGQKTEVSLLRTQEKDGLTLVLFPGQKNLSEEVS